jgi:polyisoprenyl-phosphate glycosyltransferase
VEHGLFQGQAAVTRHPQVSVAIAVYNEEAVLPELLRRLDAVLLSLPGGPHEIVFVDDGSADATMEMLARAARADPRITVVRLSRNFGHQAALSAALDHVSGDAVIVMDGDLQDPPEAIPRLVEEHLKGFDVVYVRRMRRKERWLLRLCYFLFYRIMATAASIRLPLDAGDFALLSRRVVLRLRETREHHRYLRGLRSWVGFRQTGVALERAARHSGRSKYSSLKLIALALDGLVSFSVAPLRAAAGLGLATIAGAFLFALYSVYVRFVLGHSPQGFTAVILVMTFMSGVQLLFLGVIGEYLGRVYEEVKGRPQYIVDEVVRNAAGRFERSPETAVRSDSRRPAL